MNARLLFCVLLVAIAGCGGGSHAVTPPPILAGSSPLDLESDPVALTNDNPAATFVVQNDAPGVAYTPTAGPDCVGPGGAIAVAGDGQPIVAAAGTPTMFTAYTVGATPPATCTLTVTDNVGNFGTVGATYEVLVVQSNRLRAPARLVTRGVTAPPLGASITKLNQVVQFVLTGYTGPTTLSTGTCAKSPGISVNPTSLPAGSGQFVIVPFGTGAIAKTCTVSISDTAGNTGSVQVSLAIAALGKLTVSPDTVQFGCTPGAAPKHCQTIQQVTVSEPGAAFFKFAPRAFPNTTCIDTFEGPLRWIAGGVPSVKGVGPSTTVAFDGILPQTPIGCSRIPITDGGNPQQTVSLHVIPKVTDAPPPPIATLGAPPCTGNDPRVGVPTAPHGMYAWSPNKLTDGTGKNRVSMTTLLQKYAIGIDPTLCGASLTVLWTDVESNYGAFDWTTVESDAAPYTSKGLTVNLLFVESSETKLDNVTPSWVFADPSLSGTCGTGPPEPVYWNTTYEGYWESLISAAIQHFGNPDPNKSPIASKVGYMRFATGAGAEAVPPNGYNDNGTCQAMWESKGYSYTVWQQHGFRILNAMAGANASLPAGWIKHQLIASLPSISFPSPLPSPTPSIYDVPNAFADVAAAQGIGLSFESLGTTAAGNAPTVGPNPTPCQTNAKMIVLHWCQAYTKYAGVVPLAMQPIYASLDPRSSFTLPDALAYALNNNIQVFELYPGEWLEANGDTTYSFYHQEDQAAYHDALTKTSLILGATNGK